MDKNTFGKAPCFVRLAEILDEINDEKLTSKVSKTLHSYIKRLKKLDYLEDREDRIYFSTLLVNAYAKSVATLYKQDSWPTNVYSHLLTCLRSRYRMFINTKRAYVSVEELKEFFENDN